MVFFLNEKDSKFVLYYFNKNVVKGTSKEFKSVSKGGENV